MVCCLREKAGRPVRAWRGFGEVQYVPVYAGDVALGFQPGAYPDLGAVGDDFEACEGVKAEDCPAPFAADHLAANTGRHRVTLCLAPAQPQLACHAADCGAADAQVAGHLGVGTVVEVAANMSGTFQPPALSQLFQSEFAGFLLHSRHTDLQHIGGMCGGLHGIKLGKPGEHGFCPVDFTHGIRVCSC